jgi:hypothetical protein
MTASPDEKTKPPVVEQLFIHPPAAPHDLFGWGVIMRSSRPRASRVAVSQAEHYVGAVRP